MARYIDADILRDEWLYGTANERVYEPNDVLDSIDNVPTADVQRVIHAKWSPQMVARKDNTGDYHFGFECSVCHEIASKTVFCGWCGAIMDGKTDEKQE